MKIIAAGGNDIEASAKTMLPYLAVGVLTVTFVPRFTHAVPNLLGLSLGRRSNRL